MRGPTPPVPPRRVALRLAHVFGTSAEFWLNLQSVCERRLGEAKTSQAIKKLPTLKHLEDAHA
jgi:plasmid maintenance system antidote protein VapI